MPPPHRGGVRGPRGKPWGASTIYGNWRRGTGILNNELYAGKIVWNRQRFVKDPERGRRQARPNPKSEWVVEEVPALRIIDEALWARVKSRQTEVRQALIGDKPVARCEDARRPRYLFSGLLTCGTCGGGYTMVGARHYGCANVRNRGTCDNRLTIRRDALESAVLDGLNRHPLQPDLICEFVEEYSREFNRLRREQAMAQAVERNGLAKVERQILGLIEAIKDGLYIPSIKDEMLALEARKAALTEDTKDATEERVLLHPGLADVYRHKVETLTEALNKDELRTEAAEDLRAMIQTILLIPQDGELAIELVGELAGILAVTHEKTPRQGARGFVN